jgi:hypothetical protein
MISRTLRHMPGICLTCDIYFEFGRPGPRLKCAWNAAAAVRHTGFGLQGCLILFIVLHTTRRCHRASGTRAIGHPGSAGPVLVLVHLAAVAGVAAGAGALAAVAGALALAAVVDGLDVGSSGGVAPSPLSESTEESKSK